MNKSRVLITGANGLLGGKVIKTILENTCFDVTAVAATKKKVLEMEKREGIKNVERIHFLSNHDFLNFETELLDNVYGAVHFAFSRRIRPADDIAASIDFSAAVFNRLAGMDIDRVINVSTQAVYGGTSKIRTEDMIPAPESIYAMAKYAAEKIFELCMEKSFIQNYTSLRLDLVVQSQKVVKMLCEQAKIGKLQLRGGEQRFSFIDAEDAANAVVTMLQSPAGWDRVYNVGWNRVQYSLMEVAEIVAETAEKKGYAHPEIELDKQEIVLWSGMDSSKFMGYTGWKPKLDLRMMTAGFFD